MQEDRQTQNSLQRAVFTRALYLRALIQTGVRISWVLALLALLVPAAGPVAESRSQELGAAGDRSVSSRLDAATGPADKAWLDQAMKAIGSSEYHFSTAADGVVTAPNRGQNLRSHFNRQGLVLTPRVLQADPAGMASALPDDALAAAGQQLLDWSLSLQVVAFGRDGSMQPTRQVLPEPDGERVFYRRQAFDEWYVNDSSGLEQRFTIHDPPRDAGSGLLAIAMQIDGLRPQLAPDPRTALFKGPGNRTVLHYTGLTAWDASGESVPATLDVQGESLRILVDDREAVYPLEIDPVLSPVFWTAFGGLANGQFGIDVATAGDVNGDGYSDILIGANDFDGGAIDEGKAFIYLGSSSGPGTMADWTARGSQVSAFFGQSVAPAGDVNCDGYDDIIIGAHQYEYTTVREGAAFVFLGGPFMTFPSDVSALAANWRAHGNQTDSWFGIDVATAGDVNGDGCDEVIVGAPQFNNGSVHEGVAMLWMGSSSGLGATGDTGNTDWFAEGNQAEMYLGSAVGTAGDTSGNGTDDVIVGAPFYDVGMLADIGAAYVWRSVGGALISGGGNPANADWDKSGNNAGSQYGRAVAPAGDVNGDGYADVLVGDPFNNGPFVAGGRVILYLGTSTGPSPAEAWSVRGDSTNKNLGRTVSSAGDMNGDGYADVAVARFTCIAGTATAWAVVFEGSAAGLDSTPTWCTDAGGGLGTRMAAAGDVDGDGFGDLLVSSPISSSSNGGRVSLFRGEAPLGPSLTPAWEMAGGQASAGLGWDLAMAGDVNGDGYTDILLGVPFYDGGLVDSGRILLFFGSEDGPDPASADWTQNGFGGQFGRSVDGAGDVNGDGYGDILVGAPFFSGAFGNEGKAYIYHGGPTGPTGTVAWSTLGGELIANLGEVVSGAGDINGDGFADILVGAPNVFANSGAVFVHHGSASGVSATADRVLTEVAFADYGVATAGAGDVNGDGFDDVLVGAPFLNEGIVSQGGAYLYSGSPLGLSAVPAWSVQGGQVDGEMGTAVAGAGDLNGDGLSDMVIGMPGYTEGAKDEGGAFVWYGVPDLSTLGRDADWSASSKVVDARLGTAVGAAGDVNGDGFGDLFVGAPDFTDVRGSTPDEGMALVWLGSRSGPTRNGNPANADWKVEGQATSAHMGGAAAGAGDVNGDGFADLLVGAYFKTDTVALEGMAFIHYGSGNEAPAVRPMQFRADATAPVGLMGRPNSVISFKLRVLARSAVGRTTLGLQWEVKPLGQPFDGTGLGTSLVWNDSGPVSGNGSDYNFQETATGLSPGMPYHWRARVVTTSPLFPHSRWLYMPGNSPTENDLRMGGFGDLDGDGETGATDCNDADPDLWAAPQAAVDTLEYLNGGFVMSWDEPLDPGGVPGSMYYDTVRSTSSMDFDSGGLCHETNGADTLSLETADPGPGVIWFYLVRPENDCAMGPVLPATAGPRTVVTCN